MTLFKPNKTTASAVRHPVGYSVGSAIGAALIAAMGFGISGALSAVVGGVAAFVLVALISYSLWRPGGVGAKWYERNGSGSDAVQGG